MEFILVRLKDKEGATREMGLLLKDLQNFIDIEDVVNVIAELHIV